MRPALLLFGYALAVAWWAPALLSRLTARGISPRLGLAACRARRARYGLGLTAVTLLLAGAPALLALTVA